ncbi:MAG: hypothetical protein IJS39_01775 [Synergistaceae bacterium]|nr:hypothetical protein [Synergistaceae bacterium]
MLYGSEHAESYGVNTEVYQPERVFSPEEADRYALIEDVVIMVCSVHKNIPIGEISH